MSSRERLKCHSALQITPRIIRSSEVVEIPGDGPTNTKNPINTIFTEPFPSLFKTLPCLLLWKPLINIFHTYTPAYQPWIPNFLKGKCNFYYISIYGCRLFCCCCKQKSDQKYTIIR